MLLLIVFAFVAGAGTAITPCVLPVVPALLSASGVGGRRRPLGIVLGLGITFTVSIVVLSRVLSDLGLRGSAARTLAVIVLIVVGVVLLFPGLNQRIQVPLSRLARFGPASRGEGFLSGLLVGAALGFVCAPCAGPILGAVLGVSNSAGGATLRSTVVAVAYSLGLCLVMLLYGFGGRWVLTRVKAVAGGYRVERVLAVILLATGVALAFNLDTDLTSLVSRHENSLPAILTDPTRGLENNHTVHHELASLGSRRTLARGDCPAAGATRALPVSVGLQGVTTPKLGCLGRAPNFTRTQEWFNTPGGRPESISELHGKVVLVDFWTYTCINCIRTLPFIEGLYRTYHRYGLDVVGVETPEFSFEQEAANVRQAIATDHLTYPVVQDNDYGTWNAYGNEYWPADYLIDADGEIRHTQFGEGDYAQEEAAVRALLYDAGHHHLPAPTTARAVIPSRGIDTAENYLNPERYDSSYNRWVQPIQLGTHTYAGRVSDLDEWALNGSWNGEVPVDQNDEGSITPVGAAGGSITGDVEAKDVYLVMTSQGNVPRRGRVLFDGKPIPALYAGSAVGPDGFFTVTRQTLYNLVNLPRDLEFALTVQLPEGVNAYDFTFG